MKPSIILVALLSTACAYHNPTAPTPPPTPIVQVPPPPLPTPTPTPTPPIAPLTVRLLVQAGQVNTPSTFSLASNGGVVRATWDFGDGVVVTTNEPYATHVYERSGMFSASVTIIDELARTESATASVVVAPAPTVPPVVPPSLTASLTCVPSPHGTPTSCNVTASLGAVLPSAAITRVAWDWGDGTTQAIASPLGSHAYVQAGKYTVFATVAVGSQVATTSTQVVTP